MLLIYIKKKLFNIKTIQTKNYTKNKIKYYYNIFYYIKILVKK